MVSLLIHSILFLTYEKPKVMIAFLRNKHEKIYKMLVLLKHASLVYGSR
jgi:hypothetical protein